MEPRLISNIAKLSPYPSVKKNLPSLAFVYAFEPPPDDKRGLGNFFVVIEVMAKRQLAGEVTDLIIKTLGDVYYNDDSGEIIDDRFEAALTSVNKNIQGLGEKSDHDLSGKISAVVAILADDILHLSRCGNASAYLYRDGKTSDIAEDLNEDSPVATDKLFHNVANGRLEEKDKLLLGTPAIFFHFKRDELAQLISDNSPSAAVQKISSLVSGEENAARFGAVIVELQNPETAAAQTLPEEKAVAMVGTPPSLAKEAKEMTDPITQKAAKKTTELAGQVKDWSKDKLVPSVKAKSKSGWNTLWTRYINPNPKLALLVASVVILIFIGFSFYLSANSSVPPAKMVTFKEAVALTDTAEAKLTLNQKSAAAEAATSAEKKLHTVAASPLDAAAIDKAAKRDPDLKNKSITVASVQKRLDLVEDKIAGVNHISPEVVYDFKTIKNAKISQSSYLGDNVYAVDSADGSLYKVDVANKSAKNVGSDDQLKDVVSATAGSTGDVVYFLTTTPSVVQYKPGSGVSTAKLSAGEWEAGNDIASYVGNLYILSRNDDQIWRHTPTAIGFSSRSSWLKSDNSVSDSVSLVVNGNIFTINEQNKLAMYASGEKKDFSTNDLPSGIGKPTKMILSEDSNQLYVLSAESKKIYRLNLTDQGAAYDKQYALDNVSSVKSFSLDQKNSVIYVVADNKVVKFTP